MARYQQVKPEEMTAEQRRVYDKIAAGPRGSAQRGPFMAWLPSPALADLAQELGAHCRFRSSLPAKHYEVAILMVAKHWRAQYEWYAHAQLALKAGIDPSIVEAIHRGETPKAMSAEEAAIHGFAKELLETRRVSAPTFERARQLLGQQGVVDLVGVMGYYGLVSMTLNAFEVPMPPGEPAPFKD